MDIQAFLSSGTTHVHTKEPQGNFAKAAKAVVLALSLGAVATATADTTSAGNGQSAVVDRASSISQMPYAGDAVSVFYQALLAPGPADNVRVVSTRSTALMSVLQGMPTHIQDRLNSTPDILSRSVRTMDESPFAMSVGVLLESQKTNESVCMVNALESVGSHVKHSNGAPYVGLAQLNVGADQLSAMAGLSPYEAAQVTMIHELAHCEYNVSSEAHAAPPGSRLEMLFRTSFNETAADLAVALYYASKEGSFTNAQLALSSVRATTDNGDHSTLDMLDMVLSRLDPEAFKGMPINKLFQHISPIMNGAWNDYRDDLRKAFLQEIVEGGLLHNRLTGESSAVNVPAERMEAFKTFVPGFTYNPYARAHEKLDSLLNHGLRNPDFQRQIGLITVAKVEDAARKMGVQPTPEQIIKARYLDPEFSPPGTKGAVGLPGAVEYREVNYLNDLQQQAKQNIDKHIISAPRFN